VSQLSGDLATSTSTNTSTSTSTSSDNPTTGPPSILHCAFSCKKQAWQQQLWVFPGWNNAHFPTNVPVDLQQPAANAIVLDRPHVK
jgi:hypothetical protein